MDGLFSKRREETLQPYVTRLSEKSILKPHLSQVYRAASSAFRAAAAAKATQLPKYHLKYWVETQGFLLTVQSSTVTSYLAFKSFFPYYQVLVETRISRLT